MIARWENYGVSVTGTGERLRKRLADARLYLCTGSREFQGDLPQFLDAVLGAGVDIVQLREKGLEAGPELRLLDVFRRACDRHGALMAVNDRADLAVAAGADVLHVGQDDLPPELARRITGSDPVIGLSAHSDEQVGAAAADPAVDYFCAGPIWETPTKPGRPAAGLGVVRHAASSRTGRPWFAIGGIDEANLEQVLEAGASRIVVVRVLTQADDPGSVAARLASRLSAAGR